MQTTGPTQERLVNTFSHFGHHTMNPQFVVDGDQRLRRSAGFQARLRELRESIQARHAAAFAQAGFFQRLLLRWRIAAEFRRESRKIEPSPGSLYSVQIAARRI